MCKPATSFKVQTFGYIWVHSEWQWECHRHWVALWVHQVQLWSRCCVKMGGGGSHSISFFSHTISTLMWATWSTCSVSGRGGVSRSIFYGVVVVVGTTSIKEQEYLLKLTLLCILLNAFWLHVFQSLVFGSLAFWSYAFWFFKSPFMSSKEYVVKAPNLIVGFLWAQFCTRLRPLFFTLNWPIFKSLTIGVSCKYKLHKMGKSLKGRMLGTLDTLPPPAKPPPPPGHTPALFRSHPFWSFVDFDTTIWFGSDGERQADFRTMCIFSTWYSEACHFQPPQRTDGRSTSNYRPRFILKAEVQVWIMALPATNRSLFSRKIQTTGHL